MKQQFAAPRFDIVWFN